MYSKIGPTVFAHFRIISSFPNHHNAPPIMKIKSTIKERDFQKVPLLMVTLLKIVIAGNVLPPWPSPCSSSGSSLDFDFFWYLQNKIEPDWVALQELIGIANKTDLKNKVLDLIDKRVTEQKLAFDLINFFPDQMFVETFCKNYKELIMKYL